MGCDDVTILSKLLSQAKFQDKIGLVVTSYGGSGEVALRLINLLRNHFKKIVLIAPYQCASAATMLALGCDEIMMGPAAFLTPVDTSLEHPLGPTDPFRESVSVSENQLQRILKLWGEHKGGGTPFPELYKYLHPVVIGELDRIHSLSLRICGKLLSYHMADKKKIKRIIHALNFDYPCHSYPITRDEAKKLGLNVRAIEKDLMVLLEGLDDAYLSLAQRREFDRTRRGYSTTDIDTVFEVEGKQIAHVSNMSYAYDKRAKSFEPCYQNDAWSILERVKNCWCRGELVIT